MVDQVIPLPQAEVKRRVEQYLESLPRFNALTIWYMIAMSISWGLSALSLLSFAFIVDNGNDGFRTIEADFDIDDAVFYRSREFDVILFFVAAMIFASLGPTLSDRFGRRPVVVLSIFILGASYIGAAAAPNYPVFLVARAAQGAAYSSVTAVPYIFLAESLAPSRHNVAALCLGIGWVFGYVMISPISVVLPTWRGLYYAFGVPCTLFSIVIFVTLPESLMYLAINGKYEKVEGWVWRADHACCAKRSALSGNTPTTQTPRLDITRKPSTLDNEMTAVEPTADGEESRVSNPLKINPHIGGKVKEIFHNRRLVCNMIVLSIIWGCDMVFYGGVSVLSTAIDVGNWRVNFALGGIMELPSLVIMQLLMRWFGVKHVVMVLHVIAGAAMLSIYGLSVLDHDRKLPVLYLILFCSCKFTLACMELLHFVYASDIFPPHLRGICMGICVTLKTIGLIAYPHSIHLEKLDDYLTFAFYGTMSWLLVPLAIPLPNSGKPSRKQKEEN